MKQQKKIERALAEVNKIFGDVQITTPLESLADKIREAASVIKYFDMHEEFKTETCRHCKLEFKYAYYLTAVKCCSIPCMAAVLAEMGLSWNPEAPLERRWGRYVPAIVPPGPTEILQEQIKSEETLSALVDTTDDLLDFIRSVGQ